VERFVSELLKLDSFLHASGPFAAVALMREWRERSPEKCG
jgi:hypothetical protein